MTTYYLQTLVDDICLMGTHFAFRRDELLKINMYIEKGPEIEINGKEYRANFYFHNKMYVISSLLQLGYVVDITKSIERENKLNELLK